MRTVIVEDHELVAAHLKRSIEELGHRVVGMASSFNAAVDMLMREPAADVAFIDLVLNDDVGDPSGALLVDLATRRSIQVVVTTALTPIPDRLQGAALLTKPFSIEQVGSVMASIPKPAGAPRRERRRPDKGLRARA
jgi:DNA-binding NarL/FixJ family response regulator